MEQCSVCCRAQSIGKSSAGFVAFGVVLSWGILQCCVLAFPAPLNHGERWASAVCVLWEREYSSSFIAGWSHLGKEKETLKKTGSCRLLLIFPLIDQSSKLNDICLCSWLSEGCILHQPERRSNTQVDIALGFLALGPICKTDHFSFLYLHWEFPQLLLLVLEVLDFRFLDAHLSVA